MSASGLPPEVTDEVAEHVGQESLSPMEVRVLQMVADGNSNKEIILSKLDANDRTHTELLALKRGIIA